MRWTDERKNITFTCPNGMKCRDIKLHHDKFLKEAIENEFKIREQLTNGFQTGRINGEELEEYGRVRQQSIGAEGVFHTRETEVSGTENDQDAHKATLDFMQTNEYVIMWAYEHGMVSSEDVTIWIQDYQSNK